VVQGVAIAYNSSNLPTLINSFFLWENNGFEVYEEICRPFAKALDEVIEISRRTVLQFNDIFEQIQNSLKLWILYARTMEGESGSC